MLLVAVLKAVKVDGRIVSFSGRFLGLVGCVWNEEKHRGTRRTEK